MEFKDVTVEMRKMEGAGHDVFSRCREIADSQVTLTLALGVAETFPNPLKMLSEMGEQPQTPSPRQAVPTGFWKQGEDSGCIWQS